MLYDFGAYDAHGQLKVVVEAKKRIGTSAEWALEFRRNLFAQGGSLPGAVFVVVSPDKIYQWSNDASIDAGPDVEVDAKPLLGPYFERANTKPEQIDPQAFELLVAWWLEDLTRHVGTGPATNHPLARALAGARIARAIAA